MRWVVIFAVGVVFSFTAAVVRVRLERRRRLKLVQMALLAVLDEKASRGRLAEVLTEYDQT